MFDKKIFGTRLREIRISNNVNQDTAAIAAGITKQTLSGIETGYRAPSIEVATALADYFFVSLDYLIGRTDEPLCGENLSKAESKLLAELPNHLVLAFNHAKGDLPEEQLPEIIRAFRKLAEPEESLAKKLLPQWLLKYIPDNWFIR